MRERVWEKGIPNPPHAPNSPNYPPSSSSVRTVVRLAFGFFEHLEQRTSGHQPQSEARIDPRI
uniref:Uncharacterized protein n=1 Tax=Oryza meridionalis TaxID=40149 RepID=A0A0E0F5X3_9ORYZ